MGMPTFHIEWGNELMPGFFGTAGSVHADEVQVQQGSNDKEGCHEPAAIEYFFPLLWCHGFTSLDSAIAVIAQAMP